MPHRCDDAGSYAPARARRSGQGRTRLQFPPQHAEGSCRDDRRRGARASESAAARACDPSGIADQRAVAGDGVPLSEARTAPR